MTKPSLLRPLFPLLLAVGLPACHDSGAAPVKAPPGPVEVGVASITPRAITLSKELPGRTAPLRMAEVRARVNGIVVKRLFEEGRDVKEGQPLFRIDPAPYQAAVESAEAQVRRAEAQIASTQVLSTRYAELIKSNAISQQEHDDAMARLKGNQADLEAARAAVKTARINLEYTTVRAPIAGRIGRAAVTEGAYVQQSSATLLATIQQLDQVYVDLTMSSADALRLRQARADGQLQVNASDEAKVGLLLENGKEYREAGVLQFTDVTVDPSTGSLSMRAVFPNPHGELLPGTFVRARIEEGTLPAALLVPQRAVTRDQNGRPQALVVVAGNKLERRTLVTDRVIGDSWLITDGVKAGEQVVVEGLQKVKPGATVKTVPATAPAEKR